MFVLLMHETDSGVHWDFMIEIPDREGLATWRLAENPIDQTERAIAAEPLGDHRRVYLDFEGDIGRGRGSVIIEKCGDCRGTGRVSVERDLTIKIPPGPSCSTRVAGTWRAAAVTIMRLKGACSGQPLYPSPIRVVMLCSRSW